MGSRVSRCIAACALVCLGACGRLGFASESNPDGGSGSDDAGPEVTACSDGDRRTLFGNHCYFSYDLVRPYAQADTECTDVGAHLATIATQAEQDAVFSVFGDINQWLGLDDLATAGTFVWKDSTPLGFTNWALGEPSNGMGIESCAEMRADGEWNDRDCASDIHYVCEREPAQSATCTEGDAHVGWNGRCYSLFSTMQPIGGARTTCEQNGMQPVAIATAEENVLVRALAFATIWLGAEDLAMSGMFTWDSGDPFSYTNWTSGEPNTPGGELCIEMYSDGKWNDRPCDTFNQVVCERAGPPATCTKGSIRTETDGHCFWREDTPGTWDDAVLACQASGGHLATIDSLSGQVAAGGAAGAGGWIGVSDTAMEGSYVDITGASATLPRWRAGEPSAFANEDCVEMFDGGEWNDAVCSTPRAAICETP